MNRDSKIFVAGHRGLLGSALVRALRERGHERLLLRTRAELDLRDAAAVRDELCAERPDYVFLAAGSVGGIGANQRRPGELAFDNLSIVTAVLEAARLANVRGLVLFGSSCMYPRECAQPMLERDLWTGPLEQTSLAYASAKLAGVELCRAYRRQYGCDFRVMIPATLYGPGDHFDSARAHVIPALVTRFVRAVRERERAVTVLGSGAARREFTHSDDAARAALHWIEADSELEIVNAGSGEEISIVDLATRIAAHAGFEGEIAWDRSAPDGAPRKLLDSARLRGLGWTPTIGLDRGLKDACAEYARRLSETRESTHA